ncbi:CRISPR-associated helicase, Cas3 family [Clostridium sp. USBA 49]|uniref:CRISPR-associated helicase/endonuclease Cas3 n=1 Tax=Clostridium sp. USBA 49 TaxID=1881060 RepID=UPI0009994068|nr:CRISPR-associated helicase/endonuclease Cas3 [Clostridium sp. USBA 49]SKA90414.1 CRISPR-associated helicase, Cas3 family [Clostridium sp. USBA 49]
MYFYKLESHPGIPLIQHLKAVGDRCVELIEKKDINFSYGKDKILFVAKIMGYTHDLGKATYFFQKYLKDMIEIGESEVDKELRSHGFFSALHTYLQLRDLDKKLALICFVIVRRHHGDLNNSDMEYMFTEREVKNQMKVIKRQLESINYEEFEKIFNELSLKKFKMNEILEALQEISEETEDFQEYIDDNDSLEEYVLFKFLYSILIFSDKEDAIFHYRQNINYDLPQDLVDEYKIIKFERKISALGEVRNNIYEDVIKTIENFSERIMSITVPTGTGKTLTALGGALHLKKQLDKDMRIIYCLPFTSVIDQNFEVYSNVIETVMGEGKVTNDRILKHHHLSDFKYSSEIKNFDSNESKFLVENWNSQIVVTTFMQFFDTLFSNQNSQLVKYQSIANSIVLLDEVQSIPYKYWLVINKLFKIMSEKLNIYFILITATQPLIFDKNEIKELVPDNKKYFEVFKRTKLHINIDKISLEDFLIKIEHLIDENAEKSILIILNTIKVAQEVYEFIKELELKESFIFFLSTGIIPKERKERINNIKKIKGRKIIVSTQLIEAGVDIDVDIVVRDLATLDSINQSAGRCNREYRGDYIGDIYLCNLVNDKGREYNSFIYDNFLIDKTKTVLKDKDLIYEEDYLNLNNLYFEALHNDMSKDESMKLIEFINKLKFKDISNNFKLIEQQNKVSIFIECDGEASKVWKQYEEIRKEENALKAKEKFQEIKKQFYDYVITVFKNKVHENFDKDDIVYIPYESLNNTYDFETGYVLKDKDVIL